MKQARSLAACVLVLGLASHHGTAQAPLFPTPPLVVAGPNNTTAFQVDDLNADGKPDAIHGFSFPNWGPPTSRAIAVILDVNSASPVSQQIVLSGNDPGQVVDIATGDWNRDGALDVLVATQAAPSFLMFLGAGGGVLQAPVVVPTGVAAIALIPADVNGDGNLDVVANHSWGVSVQIGNGLGGFGSGIFTAICPSPAGSCQLNPAVALDDLDQDGNLDLVVAYPGSPQLLPASMSVYQGNGTGSFAFLFNSVWSNANVATTLVAKDVNADALPDILVTTMLATVEVRYGLGGFAFTAPLSFPVPGSVPGSSTPGLPALGDLDANGLPDLAYPSGAIALNDGIGGFVPHGVIPVIWAAWVAIADFDRDLQQDLAFARSYSGSTSYPPGISVFHNATPCSGTGYPYALGCPGSGGFVPSLSARGCASPGGFLTLSVERALGSPPSAALVVSPGTTNIQVGFGCGILVQLAGSFVVPFPLTGLPVAGQGRGSLTVFIPPSIPPGVNVALQAAILDPGSPFQSSATNGLALTIQ